MFLFTILELSVSSEIFSCIYLLEDFKRGKHLNLRDGGFPSFPTFPYFFLFCTYFSLRFLENALLSLLVHFKMSFGL